MDPRFGDPKKDPALGRAVRPLAPGTEPPAAESASGEIAEYDRPSAWSAIGATLGILVAASFAALMARALVDDLLRATGRLVVEYSTQDMALRAALGGPGAALVRILPLQLSLGLWALLLARLSPGSAREHLGLVSGTMPPRVFPILILASFGMTAGTAALAVWLIEVGAVPELSSRWIEFAKSFRAHSLGWALVMVASTSILPATCEELLFRGYLQRRLLQRWHPALAILVSSVMFGLAHGQPARMVFTVLDGIWLGYLAWRSGSVLPSMLAHAATNGAAQALLQWGPDEEPRPSGGPTSPELIGLTLFAATSLGAMVYSVRLLERAARERQAAARP